MHKISRRDDDPVHSDGDDAHESYGVKTLVVSTTRAATVVAISPSIPLPAEVITRDLPDADAPDYSKAGEGDDE